MLSTRLLFSSQRGRKELGWWPLQSLARAQMFLVSSAWCSWWCAQSHFAWAMVCLKALEVALSLPQHVEKLLYNEDRCTCDLKWHCVPHNACFIHDSCFCEGSGSFPPVKPLCPSWADFSYNWYCELASHLELHPHSPLPRVGSEVEYSPLVMLYYRVPPPA